MEYKVNFKEESNYKLVVTAKNRGRIPKWYKSFRIGVYVDGRYRGKLYVKADADEFRTGKFRLGKLSGLHIIRLIWENDYYVPGMYDANIQIKSIGFSKIEPKVGEGSISGKVLELQYRWWWYRWWYRFWRREIKPVAGAKVVLTGDNQRREVTSDNQGNYRIEGLSAGRYKITASKPGYRSQTRYLRVKENKKYKNINFYLRKKVEKQRNTRWWRRR